VKGGRRPGQPDHYASARSHLTPSTSLPAVHSILEPVALGRLVGRAYGLAVSHCRLIKAMSQDSYEIVAADRRYFLKVYRHGQRSAAEIAAEIAFLHHLDEHGVPVARPVRPAQGEGPVPVPAWEGQRYSVLYEHVPGHSPSGPLGPGQAQAYGRLLARLHQAADTFPGQLLRPALDLDFLVDRPLAALSQVWDPNSGRLQAVRHLAQSIRPRLAALPLALPGYGLCHGDFILANSHVTDQGQITFFDFDHCGPGWRAYDLALFLLESGRWDAAAGPAFLAGYQQQRPLAAQEMASLPYFQAARALFFLGVHAERLDEWGSARLSSERVEAVLSEARAALARAD
jgi:Ser/Thr protein kinase RdoA (MazF antagonist)